jgi:predicted kinase
VATLAARLRARAVTALDPSEATQAVLDHQLRTLQPLTPDELQYAVSVDTGIPGAARGAIEVIRSRLAAIVA